MKTPGQKIRIGLLLACIATVNAQSETDYRETLPYSYASPSVLEFLTGGVVGNGGTSEYLETLEFTYTKPKDKTVEIAASSQNGNWVPSNSGSTGGVDERSKWTDSTHEIHRRLVSIGYEKDLASYMLNACKSRAENPRHCIVTMGFVGVPESQAGATAYENNVFGFRDTKFQTREKAVDAWLDTYVRKWYKTKWPIDFYSPKPGLPKTRYCVDEVQPDGRVLPYCPNWYKHATAAYRKLTK